MYTRMHAYCVYRFNIFINRMNINLEFICKNSSVVKRLIVINRVQNIRFVYCVYVLCIHTHMHVYCVYRFNIL